MTAAALRQAYEAGAKAMRYQIEREHRGKMGLLLQEAHEAEVRGDVPAEIASKRRTAAEHHALAIEAKDMPVPEYVV